MKIVKILLSSSISNNHCDLAHRDMLLRWYFSSLLRVLLIAFRKKLERDSFKSSNENDILMFLRWILHKLFDYFISSHIAKRFESTTSMANNFHCTFSTMKRYRPHGIWKIVNSNRISAHLRLNRDYRFSRRGRSHFSAKLSGSSSQWSFHLVY